MSRLYILILPKGVGWCILAALGVVILLALYHNYPLGLHALSLLHQEIVYDVMLDAGHGGIDPGPLGQVSSMKRLCAGHRAADGRNPGKQGPEGGAHPGF